MKDGSMRVLVCGSRDWATGDMKTDPWYPEEPQCDTGSIEYQLVENMLTGLAKGFIPRMEVLIEGAAPGADSCAWHWVERFNRIEDIHGYNTRIEHLHYPAQWFDEDGEFRKWAGPERNKIMLEDGRPDLVLAFSNDLENSRGTSHMVKIAKEAGIEVVNIRRV